ncbi:ABC transporter ATP-binding protein [Pleomorphomonas diazotrophica]|uniref:ABC transporter ATP-binding protein n=1 Tax=Pleomorphomonas diazotrophica TaxID=1166257 RepID=A0A1I4VTK7_9HYPH|nr:ABC transporter substrate-binding protein [Pleomorphomonas diazotrophica]PKR89310.1 ABC transporter ATP-binding protein [Pleomorphomonas diazotrophica]SFN04389.1 putative hydroxymethylpyrimidine transport system substrate-binding protein [Pleomorphomonas diazotrophica]
MRLLPALAAALMLAAAPASATEKLSVLLEWFVNPDHAPLVVAKEKGLFAAHGLDVDLVAPADPSAPPRLVAAGQADVALHYQPSLSLDVEAGLPLVRFGTLIETPLNTLIALKDGPIKSLADLKGRKIGYSVSGFEDAMLGQFLKTAGLTIEDVELINVNFALSASLLAGQVDAVVGGYRNFELNQMKIEGHEGVAFYPEENGMPAYDELIYVTRKELVPDKRLPQFLAAVEEATIYLTNHPDDAWALFVKAYPDLDDELNRRAWADTLPRFAKRPAALDAGRYARFSQFMKDAGLIKTVKPVEDYAVELR